MCGIEQQCSIRASLQGVRVSTLASWNPVRSLLHSGLILSSRARRRSPLNASGCSRALWRSIASSFFSSLMFFPLLLYSFILSSLPTHSLSNAQHVSILSPLTSLSLPLLSSALLSSVLASVRVTSGTSSLLPPMHTRYARQIPAASSRIALRSPTPTLHANGTDAPIPLAFWHVMQCVPASPLSRPSRLQTRFFTRLAFSPLRSVILCHSFFS